MSFNTLTYYVCLNYCHVLQRTTVTLFALAIETGLKTCLPRINLRQITLLRGYTHPNNPWYLYHKCFIVSLHIGDFTFFAHAQKGQSERLKRRKI